ncbi:hypothetical protein GJAV_G00182540 [Gymnothorax javanicus]|nr:hypothetical protein GJAV_G00182540 [Gymnothorax javanicus]
MKKRGSPKGLYRQTAIGLSSRRTGSENKPLPFWRKPPKDKDLVMLKWFVSSHSAEIALMGTTLTEAHVKAVDDTSDAFKDDNVDVHRIKEYFSPSGDEED